MYRRLEKYCEKNLKYNRINKIEVIFEIIGMVLFVPLYLIGFWWIIFFIIPLLIYVMIKVFSFILKQPITIGFKNTNTLDDIIYYEDMKIIKDYLKKNKLYNKKSMLLMIEHYRLYKRTINSNSLSFMSLFTIFFPSLVTLINNDYIMNPYLIVSFLKVLIISIIICIIICNFVKIFTNYKDIFMSKKNNNYILE